MKRVMQYGLCLGLLLSLAACAQPPADKYVRGAPTPEITAALTPEATATEAPTPRVIESSPPKPTETPKVYDSWQDAYTKFLREYRTRQATRPVKLQEYYKERYSLYDIDKDGIPELFFISYYSQGESSCFCSVLSWKNGYLIKAEEHREGYADMPLDATYGSFYSWPGENAVLYNNGWTFSKVSLIGDVLIVTALEHEESVPYIKDAADFFAPGSEKLLQYPHRILQPIFSYGSDLTEKDAAEIYLQFLTDQVSGTDFVSTIDYHSSYTGLTRRTALQRYYVEDLTGDGIPELYCPGPGESNVWTIQDGTTVTFKKILSEDTILANGGIFSYQPGLYPLHARYTYRWLTPESQEYPEITFAVYDMNENGDMDTYTINYEEVSHREWRKRIAPYLALRDAQPTEAQRSVPFLEWLEELGITVPDLEPQGCS